MKSENLIGFNKNGDPLFKYEFVKFSELYAAYEDCKRQKMHSKNCIDFVEDDTRRLYKLWFDLNSLSYEIGPSICFVTYDEILKRKYREIFAADFVDRIVQHLVINRLNPVFESIFIPYTFSCRKGKGTSAAIYTLREEITKTSENFTKDCWVVQLDIKAFFPQINKTILERIVLDKLRQFRNSSQLSDEDFEFTLELIKLIIRYNPRIGCKFKSQSSIRKNLPPHKSAFNIPDDKYLAVGNITSQFFANILLSDLDNRVSSLWTYLRYVDDMAIIIEDKNDFRKVVNIVNEELSKLSLELSPNKIKLSHYSKGVKFVGKIIKFDRLYANNETIGKAWKFVNHINGLISTGSLDEKFIPFAINKMNSYLGLLMNTNSFNIRKCLCLASLFGKYAYVLNDFSKFIIYEDFKIYKTKKKNMTKEEVKNNPNKIIYKHIPKKLR